MRREGGFTLLEVLVALVIAGLAVAALVQGSLTGLQSARLAGHYDEALVRARSRLAALGQSGTLAAGTQEGDDGGGFHWRTEVAETASVPAAPGRPVPLPALYAVAVTVTWAMDGGERRVSLQSERVGSALPRGP